MADGVTIKVDATAARLKLGRVTPAVRNSLRGVIPDLVRQLASLVNAKLGSELKTRTSLTVAQELRESTNQIYGVARLESAAAEGLLPQYLELGTRPHEIAGNPFLAFYWDKVGADVVFRRVDHPGTKDYRFMERSFDEMKNEIVNTLREAAQRAATSVR